MSSFPYRKNDKQGFATRAIHHGYDSQTSQGALNPPIYLTSTYTFETAEEGAAIFAGQQDGYIYGRTKNPTQSILESRLANLEGGEAGLAVASGMAAITALSWTLLSAGDRVVIDRVLYGNSFAFFTRGISRFGVEVEIVDFTDLDQVAAALQKPAKFVYFETPANPNLRLIDIAGVAGIAHAAGALVVVDNTFATPVLQRPLEHGADLVVHSVTKYLGGHGDLLAGALIGSADHIKQIRMNGLRHLTGAAISPLTAFLVLRGIKTLELRVAQHVRSARAVAEFLVSHPAVASVAYPGLPDFPQAALARRQMSDGGGLVSFELKGGIEAGRAFMNALTLAKRAVSLGDAETLVQHPASMTHATYTAEERQQHGISDGLIRLSAGLETTVDILADIEAALSGLRAA